MKTFYEVVKAKSYWGAVEYVSTFFDDLEKAKQTYNKTVSLIDILDHTFDVRLISFQMLDKSTDIQLLNRDDDVIRNFRVLKPFSNS